jgi:hypothetical protein
MEYPEYISICAFKPFIVRSSHSDQRFTNVNDYTLSRRPWTEADLQCPADRKQLPTELHAFWEGLEIGVERTKEEFAKAVERRPKPRL